MDSPFSSSCPLTPLLHVIFFFLEVIFAWHPTRAGSVGHGMTEVAIHLGQDKSMCGSEEQPQHWLGGHEH